MKSINYFLNFFLETVFPIKCFGCGKEKSWLCDACFSKIKIKDEFVCPKCEKVFTPFGKTCIKCKEKCALNGLIPATHYKENMVSLLIHNYKYRFIKDLDIYFGNLICSCLKKSDLPIPDFIIPIPLHPRRLRWRGFNQSSLIAKYISRNLLEFTEVTVLENIIIRKRYTRPQMQIKEHYERQKNLADAFTVLENEIIKDKTILLVDDVTTTGSTLFECAKVLKKSGAREVYAAVIARQEF